MFEIRVTSGEYKGRTVCVNSLDAAIKEFGEANIDRSTLTPYTPKIVEYSATAGWIAAHYDDGSSSEVIDCNGDQQKAEQSAAKMNAKL